jgi:hypothetical protein
MRVLALLLLLALASCQCKDKTLLAGAGNDHDPCSMNCIDRDGRNCACSSRCPCWKAGPGKQRVHLKKGELFPEK